MSLRRNCPAGTSEFISFWRQLGSPLVMKIPGDSFLGIPLCFRWRLIINVFWRQLESLLEFSHWHLGINSVWRQLGSSLVFSIPGDLFSGIPTCFPRWGLLWLFVCGEIHFPPLGVYYSSPFLENYMQQIPCLECRVELTAGSMMAHHRQMHRMELAIYWNRMWSYRGQQSSAPAPFLVFRGPLTPGMACGIILKSRNGGTAAGSYRSTLTPSPISINAEAKFPQG